MKPLILSVSLVMAVEGGTVLVMLNASPHPPFGFCLWFGGIAAISPFVGYGLYRRLTVKA